MQLLVAPAQNIFSTTHETRATFPPRVATARPVASALQSLDGVTFCHGYRRPPGHNGRSTAHPQGERTRTLLMGPAAQAGGLSAPRLRLWSEEHRHVPVERRRHGRRTALANRPLTSLYSLYSSRCRGLLLPDERPQLATAAVFGPTTTSVPAVQTPSSSGIPEKTQAPASVSLPPSGPRSFNLSLVRRSRARRCVRAPVLVPLYQDRLQGRPALTLLGHRDAHLHPHSHRRRRLCLQGSPVPFQSTA